MKAWLKGGILFALLDLALIIRAFWVTFPWAVNDLESLNFGIFLSQWPVSVLSYYLPIPVATNLIHIILAIILGLIFWFVVGSIIGWLVGLIIKVFKKIKK